MEDVALVGAHLDLDVYVRALLEGFREYGRQSSQQRGSSRSTGRSASNRHAICAPGSSMTEDEPNDPRPIL